MVTYYVKLNDVYTITATAECKVYNASDTYIATCPANSSINIKATTNKLKLSDDNAVFKNAVADASESTKQCAEHIANVGIHTTANEKTNCANHIVNANIHTTANEKANFTTHIANSDIHITTNEKTNFSNHIVNGDIHVTEEEKNKWNGCATVTQSDKNNLNVAYEHTTKSNLHVADSERTTWNSKADGTHAHEISDITNLQNTLNGKASSSHTHNTSDINSLDVGVKRIDYWTNEGEGVQVYSNSKTLTDASSFSDSKEYKATKDVCLIYTVTNSPGSGQTSDFSGFYYNYPLKMYMTVKVNGSYLLCEAASRRVCSGGIDFIEVHLKAGDEVKFNTASISNYTGYVRVRLLEFNYR